MKRGLRSILTAVGVVLVSSCGVHDPSASKSNSGPPAYRVLDRFTVTEFGAEITVLCRGKHMYVTSDVYYGIHVQRIDNHKECENG